MSPDAPEKQSKYSVFANLRTYPSLPEAVIPHVRQDHVIDHVDPHQHARRHQPPVSRRRRRSAPDRLRGDCETARAPPRRAAAASRNTSRGCTMLASSVPIDSTMRPQHAVLRVEQQHAELLDRAVPVLRQQVLGDRPRRR